MAWTKILNKEFWNENIGKIMLAIALTILLVSSFIPRDTTEYSIGEDVASLRSTVERLEESNSQTIAIIEGLIESNDRISEGLGELSTENQRVRDLAIELATDNRELTRGLREIQDRTLESEFVTDGIGQVIRRIERDNGFD